jgi:hypothetical protein
LLQKRTKGRTDLWANGIKEVRIERKFKLSLAKISADHQGVFVDESGSH